MIEKHYTIKEVAEILQVSERTVFRYIHPDAAEKLKASKIGRAWRIAESDLKEFIRARSNS